MAKHKKKSKKHVPAKAPAFDNRPLAGLKQLPKRHKIKDEPIPESSLSEEANLVEPVEDDDLFAQAMSGVAPLPGHTSDLPPEPRRQFPPPVEDREAEEVMQALSDLVSGESGFSIHQTDEAIEGLAPGVDTRLLKKLKRGEFSVQDHLDLHGQTREEARQTVNLFLQQAVSQSKRCVLIIHGRGHGSKDKVPVLKTAIKSWFIKSGIRKLILAFCTARPCDGGAGALVVLLRKRLPGSAP